MTGKKPAVRLNPILPRSHPEQSRFPGGAKDLARTAALLARARSLRPLEKARAFGMTPVKKVRTVQTDHYLQKAPLARLWELS